MTVARKHALVFVAITVLLDTIGFGLIFPVHLPGAPFLAAAILASGCFVVYWGATREEKAESRRSQSDDVRQTAA